MSGNTAIVTAVGLYVFLRWILRPLATRLPTGLTLAVDLVGALLLLPEYLCSTALRKTSKRAAPMAYLYGETISTLAVLANQLGLVLTDALERAASGIGHRQAVIGGLIGTACLALLS